jgi:hypothetical protein
MKKHLPLFFLALLALNVVFLYYNWIQQSNAGSQTSLHNEILKITEQELLFLFSRYRGYNPEFQRRRSSSVLVFVHERHCSLCKEEAAPYWKAIEKDANVDFRLYYYSLQPRGWERFALWMELPKEQIIPVSSIACEDTLLWSSTAPSVLVVDNQTKEVKFAHVGSSHLRKRSIVFYEFLIKYLTEKVPTGKS